MKIKFNFKDTGEIPDRLRRKALRLMRKTKRIVLKSKPARRLARYGKMEVGLALRKLLKLVRFQLSIRPRIKLVTRVLGILVLALVIASATSDYLKSKEQDIKINGQPILVAANATQDTKKEVEISQAIIASQAPFSFKMPVPGYISQGFRFYHRAVDIATGSVGIPVKPLGTGHVEFAGYMPDGRGRVVIVDHGQNLKSLYAHLGAISVVSGSQVGEDTTIGTVGLTGRTTGAHLHLELYDNGISVDPSKVIEN